MAEKRHVYVTDRLTENQIEALCFMMGNRDPGVEEPGKRTLDSLQSRGVLVDDRVVGKGLSIVAKVVAPGSPAGQKILMELIGQSPLVVSKEKWEYWPLVSAAHKQGMIRQTLDFDGGFNSGTVKVTLSWATPKTTPH
jgi:hypothetical protein